MDIGSSLIFYVLVSKMMILGRSGRMRLAIPNRSAYMRAHGMYVVAHSLQPTACVFARIDYICVHPVCVCVCVSVCVGITPTVRKGYVV